MCDCWPHTCTHNREQKRFPWNIGRKWIAQLWCRKLSSMACKDSLNLQAKIHQLQLCVQFWFWTALVHQHCTCLLCVSDPLVHDSNISLPVCLTSQKCWAQCEKSAGARNSQQIWKQCHRQVNIWGRNELPNISSLIPLNILFLIFTNERAVKPVYLFAAYPMNLQSLLCLSYDSFLNEFMKGK